FGAGAEVFFWAEAAKGIIADTISTSRPLPSLLFFSIKFIPSSSGDPSDLDFSEPLSSSSRDATLATAIFSYRLFQIHE
ncbi:MAG: hypothetical protein WA798_04900, partial [Candidatus Acidiferrum sp.]